MKLVIQIGWHIYSSYGLESWSYTENLQGPRFFPRRVFLWFKSVNPVIQCVISVLGRPPQGNWAIQLGGGNDGHHEPPSPDTSDITGSLADLRRDINDSDQSSTTVRCTYITRGRAEIALTDLVRETVGQDQVRRGVLQNKGSPGSSTD